MLKTIAIVTILVPQLAAVESAWLEHLAYAPVHRGQVGSEEATLWRAPDMVGRDFVIMAPASREPVYLRFVAGGDDSAPAAGLTYGWNATELLATDPDALEASFEGTPFDVVGPARDLWPAPGAPRAMQATGPGGELLYFTRVTPDSFATPMRPASSPVDRVFITVVGGASISALQDFYGRLGADVGKAQPFRISTLSRAHGLPADTTYPLAMAVLPRDFMVELDEYPDSAKPRKTTPGSLPPGVAMVTFLVDSLQGYDMDWRAPPAIIAGFPYSGRRAAVAVGPAGEWVELLESSLPPP